MGNENLGIGLKLLYKYKDKDMGRVTNFFSLLIESHEDITSGQQSTWVGRSNF